MANPDMAHNDTIVARMPIWLRIAIPTICTLAILIIAFGGRMRLAADGGASLSNLYLVTPEAAFVLALMVGATAPWLWRRRRFTLYVAAVTLALVGIIELGFIISGAFFPPEWSERHVPWWHWSLLFLLLALPPLLTGWRAWRFARANR